LAATIREWFSDSASGGTAVQTAAPVDVKQARAKAKKKARKKTTQEAPPEAAKAADEPPPADPAPVAPPPEPPPSASRGSGLIEPPTRMPVGDPAGELRADSPGVKPIPNQPARPEKVEQLGRTLEEPKKTQLAGPKVIRVEQPENIRAPRPKAPPAAVRVRAAVPEVRVVPALAALRPSTRPIVADPPVATAAAAASPTGESVPATASSSREPAQPSATGVSRTFASGSSGCPAAAATSAQFVGTAPSGPPARPVHGRSPRWISVVRSRWSNR
jgi:hypothetical protein